MSTPHTSPVARSARALLPHVVNGLITAHGLPHAWSGEPAGCARLDAASCALAQDAIETRWPSATVALPWRCPCEGGGDGG